MTAVLLEPLARGAAWKLAFVPALLLGLAGWRLAHQQALELPAWMALWALPLACAPAVLRWKLGGLAAAAALFSLGLLAVQAVPVLLEAPSPTRVVDALVLGLAPAVAVVNGLRLQAAARTLAWLKAAA